MTNTPKLTAKERVEKRLQDLETKRNQLLAKARSMQAKENEEGRKVERIRDSLVGVWVRSQLRAGHQIPTMNSEADLLTAIDPWLTRDYDRARFGLPPIPKP